MNNFSKLFLLLMLLFETPLFAFDNEIIIEGRVVDGVSIDMLMLSKNKDDLFLFSNSKMGARVSIRELSHSNTEKNILNNGLKQSLPLVYELFNAPSFLGTSPLTLENVILGIDISAH